VADRVLVTGGAGFIGANLVPRLVASGLSVRVLDDLRNGRTSYLSGVDHEFVEGDISDAATLDTALVGVDAVVHLAAAGSVVESVADPGANFRNNAIGTFSVLEATRRAGVERLVFSSTGGALIGNATPPVNEQSLPKPISPYGASKLTAEAYLHAYAVAFGMRTVALRFANVYGPFSGHKKGAITVFFKQLWNDEPITIYGEGTASRDFMYVTDICAGIQLGLSADVPGGTVCHLATGVETTVTQLADACRVAVGKPDHPIERHPGRPGEVERNFATYDLAHEILGFTPQVSLADGLSRTWDWYGEHVFSR
jgi:UDP-glucose 4-epimerase